MRRYLSISMLVVVPIGCAAPRQSSQTEPLERPVATLEAGEIDDNEQFGQFLQYASSGAPRALAEPLSGVRRRLVVQVVDPDGRGVPDAEVRLLDGQQGLSLRTDSSGQCVLLPALEAPSQASLRLRASCGGLTAEATVAADAEVACLTLPAGAPLPVPHRLEVAILLDTTGSMSEEIDRLTATVDEVAERIAKLPGSPRLRLGLVLYRDRGSDYVTQVNSFTSDVEAFRRRLGEVTAKGGGDLPEDVCAALSAGLDELDWSGGRGVRLAFLIGDAPPHLEYDGTDYVAAAQAYAASGIKLFTLSSSGNDDVGEWVWRWLALRTRGRFLFITKGGAAGETPHHVERQDYTVQALPDLIVACVQGELAELDMRPGRVTPAPEALHRPVPDPPAETAGWPKRAQTGVGLVAVCFTWLWMRALIRRRAVPLPTATTTGPRWQPPHRRR